MAANRLFYKDAYQRQCTTDVVSVTEGKDGVAVALKESLFHAQGGGQPADRGWIDGLPVLDVRERDGELLHILPKAPSRETGVLCELDWSCSTGPCDGGRRGSRRCFTTAIWCWAAA